MNKLEFIFVIFWDIHVLHILWMSIPIYQSIHKIYFVFNWILSSSPNSSHLFSSSHSSIPISCIYSHVDTCSRTLLHSYSSWIFKNGIWNTRKNHPIKWNFKHFQSCILLKIHLNADIVWIYFVFIKQIHRIDLYLFFIIPNLSWIMNISVRFSFTCF